MLKDYFQVEIFLLNVCLVLVNIDKKSDFNLKYFQQVGLTFEMLQLMWYGFGSKIWMMWAAGLLASVSSITYPAISAYVSTHTDADKQGMYLLLLPIIYLSTSQMLIC